jgi:hypothetical protein
MKNRFGAVNKKLYISIAATSIFFLIAAIFFYRFIKDRKPPPS